MQEQNRLAVCADLRLAVAEYARTLRLERIARGADVRNLVAEVMDAPIRVTLEKFGDRRVGTERLEQFDLGIGQRDKNRRHPVVGLWHPRRHLGAERFAIDLRCLGYVAHGNCNMVETADHHYPDTPFCIIPSRRERGTWASCPSAGQPQP